MSKERLQHLAGIETSQLLTENMDVSLVKDIVYDAINELVRNQKVNVSVDAVDAIVNKAGERYQREAEDHASLEADQPRDHVRDAQLKFRQGRTRPHYAAKSPYRR